MSDFPTLWRLWQLSRLWRLSTFPTTFDFATLVGNSLATFDYQLSRCRSVTGSAAVFVSGSG
nr:MAG TPA: hypothetical protein [Caudoviricetes sp.]